MIVLLNPLQIAVVGNNVPLPVTIKGKVIPAVFGELIGGNPVIGTPFFALIAGITNGTAFEKFVLLAACQGNGFAVSLIFNNVPPYTTGNIILNLNPGHGLSNIWILTRP